MISHLNIIGIPWLCTWYDLVLLSSICPGKRILQYASYFQTYNKRWYILFIFSWIAAAQYLTWNIYGPISTSVENAYRWSDTQIAMMPNLGTILFIIAVFPFCRLLEKKGLPFVTRLAAFLILIANILRVLSTDETLFSVMAHLSSVINGIAGAVVMAAPPHLSAIWFPPEQRTLATCLGKF